MRIDHIAIWSTDIDLLKVFYEKYFNARSNDKYVNTQKGFESFFLSFESETRLEIMQMSSTLPRVGEVLEQHIGLIHFAISVGSETRVDELSATLKSDGFSIVDGPRRTGDGYYESVVLDPDGNRIEITV